MYSDIVVDVILLCQPKFEAHLTIQSPDALSDCAKSNILLCLESKGFEFLSAIHLSLMKHLLQFDLFQYDFSVWKRMKKSD